MVTYFLYEKTVDNNRLYNICDDQDNTIKIQSEAIAKQNLYINLMNNAYRQRQDSFPTH